MSSTEEPGARARSLSEVHGSVAVPRQPTFWKRLFAFIGPAYLVSVGYMDPGNWATDIAAGSKFGTALLWVLLMSNLMAVLLQSLSARLGIVTGMDLAQACRSMFDRRVSAVLWVLAEIAIAACDLAEVLGSAIGLQLLFGLPLVAGVLITAADTVVLLLLHGRGMRLMEAFIVVLILTVGLSLGVEVILAKPDLGDIAVGFIPSLPGDGALYLAIGILGATVMPHNLYLHSALVQSRRIVQSPAGIRAGIKFNVIDSVVALNGAFLINAALLVMAAATFFRGGFTEVAEIQDAHRLLEPILGASIAPIAFAIALIAAGQSSTVTGTLAGQIVMEGFVRLRLRPFVRRLVTRALAIGPALAAILWLGEGASGDLLVLSQVILSLQLSFAVIPLIQVVSDRRWMGQHRIGPVLQTLAWLVAGIIAALNLKLVFDAMVGWLADGSVVLWLTVVPAAAGLMALLAYVTVVPFLHRLRGTPVPIAETVHGPHTMPAVEPPRAPRRIAAALDFSAADPAVLNHAVMMAKAAGKGAVVTLLHVVESGAALVMGGELRDRETAADEERLKLYATELGELGVDATFDLGHGNPVDALAALVATHMPELLVVGSHGHGRVADIVHGTTVEKLRHRCRVPILVAPA